MLFFPVFVIPSLVATSLAFPRRIPLPRTTQFDSLEENKHKLVEASPADLPENAQPLQATEMLQLGWDNLPHTRRQVEELFKDLQMADLTPGLENLVLRAKPGENGEAQFVKSEPIVDIEEDRNFTVTPPERPASTPPFKIG